LPFAGEGLDFGAEAVELAFVALGDAFEGADVIESGFGDGGEAADVELLGVETAGVLVGGGLEALQAFVGGLEFL